MLLTVWLNDCEGTTGLKGDRRVTAKAACRFQGKRKGQAFVFNERTRLTGCHGNHTFARQRNNTYSIGSRQAKNTQTNM